MEALGPGDVGRYWFEGIARKVFKGIVTALIFSGILPGAEVI